MNDVKKLKEQYGEKSKGWKSYTECMSRAMLTGLAAFGLSTYFAQYLLQVKLPQKPTTKLIAPATLGCIVAWVVTARRTRDCQKAWLAAEEKQTFLTESESLTTGTAAPKASQ